MKTGSIILLTITLLYFSTAGFSQSGYEMKEGETIYIDNNGNIIDPECVDVTTSKYNPGPSQQTNVEKNTNYNEDGTLKIPGYTPTGNKDVDEQNYNKAKYLLYQNNPEEYQKWVEKNSTSGQLTTISHDEFIKMPEEKQLQILAQPEKYKVEKVTGE